MIYSTFSFHSIPFLSSHRTVYHLQRSARRLSRLFFFFFFSCLLAFKICFSLFSLSRQPFKLLLANTGTEREKKDSLSCILQAVTLQNFHWHTGVDCIVSSMQTRCEALMYGSIFFFFLQRKTDVCQKCSLLAILAQWYKNKFRFIPEFPLSLMAVGTILYDLE